MSSQLADVDRLRGRIARLQGQLEGLKSRLERSLGADSVPKEPFDAILCRIGGECWAIPVGHVEEVVLRPALRPLPEAPPWIPGLLDLRGEPLVLIDLPARVERSSRPPELTDLVLVCRVEGQRIGLVVEEVHEVRRLAPSWRQEIGLEGGRAPYVAAVFATDGQVILLVGLRRLLLLSELPETVG